MHSSVLKSFNFCVEGKSAAPQSGATPLTGLLLSGGVEASFSLNEKLGACC